METEQKTWLVNGLVPATGLTILGGASGSGKSFLAIDLAIAVATGHDFLDRRTEPVPVLFLSTEDGHDSLARRFWPHVQRLVKIKDQVPLRFAALDLDIGSDPADALRRVGEQAAMLRKRRGSGPGLIALDTIQGMSHGLDENSPTGMGAILRFLGAIRRQHGCALLAVHHTQSKGSLRGHGSLHAAAQGVVIATTENGRGILVAKKAKDARSDLKIGYRLRPVDLGIGQFGSMVSTCVIEAAEAEEPAPEQKLSLDLRIMEALRANPDLSQSELGKLLGKRKALIGKRLADLATAGRLVQEPAGKGVRYRVPDQSSNGTARTTAGTEVMTC